MAKLVHLKDIDHNPNTVVTVGTFDGVHERHRALIEAVVGKAKERDARSVVVTFDPHPRAIISPKRESIKLLTSLEERAEILASFGIDILLVIPFTRDFSLLSSEEFVKDIIYQKVGICEFVIGYDHHFGKNRSGTIETLEKLAPELYFEVQVISKREMGDTTISSTVVRRELQDEGDVVKASELLGRPYMLNGVVVHGDERGRLIGFPTANLQPQHKDKVIPKNGIYAIKARVEDIWYGGVMNIGVRPTFGGEDKTLEAYIFDFDQNIYGKTIRIEFTDRIRDERKFSGAEELSAQLESDKVAAKRILD